MRGWEPAAGVLRDTVRKAGESRGFAVARLLTQWTEVVGPEIAAVSQPVRIGYGKGGLGATLTLLVPGAAAPLVQMKTDTIRERVNACYGYNAIARIVLTQTAAQGFAAPPSAFVAAPAPVAEDAGVADTAAHVRDSALRAALEALGRNVISRPGHRKG